MAAAGKTVGECNSGDRYAGLPQHGAGVGQTDFAILVLETRAEMGSEQPVELARRKTKALGSFSARQRVADIAFHHFESGDQFGIVDMVALYDRSALRPMRGPHIRMQEPLADALGQ